MEKKTDVEIFAQNFPRNIVELQRDLRTKHNKCVPRGEDISADAIWGGTY
jgi:hypothetical protein